MAKKPYKNKTKQTPHSVASGFNRIMYITIIYTKYHGGRAGWIKTLTAL